MGSQGVRRGIPGSEAWDPMGSPWDPHGIHLGSPWDPHGINMGSTWGDQNGIRVGSRGDESGDQGGMKVGACGGGIALRSWLGAVGGMSYSARWAVRAGRLESWLDLGGRSDTAIRSRDRAVELRGVVWTGGAAGPQPKPERLRTLISMVCCVEVSICETHHKNQRKLVHLRWC